MGDQLILEEPNSKKAKMGSPNFMPSSSTNDFGFDFELPDELLETPSTNGPSTSAGQNHDGSSIIPSSSSGTTSFNMSNGPGFGGGGGPIGHHAQLDNNSFIAGQQQQAHPGSGIRGPAPSSFGSGTNSNSGNSVLEELLLTNRAPSSSAGGGPGGGHQQPMIHHQATNSPNVALAPTMNQRTPPSNVMGMPQAPQNIVNRSPMMNNLASPPNGPVGMNHIGNRPSMGVFSPDGSGNMYGDAPPPPQYGMAPNRIPGPQQIGMNSQQHQQMMMGAGGMRGPPPSSMNGPHQMNAGMGGPPMNMVRGPRPGMVPNQQPPNQQTMPFNASMHVQQQQHMNAGPPMHMNVARMNGPNSNSLMAGNAYQQDPHAGQQQPFGAVPMQQPPPQLGKSASIPVGMRPKMHPPEFGGMPGGPPAMPTQSISSPFPPQAGGQLPPPNQRGRVPSNVNMLNSNPNVAHMNVPSNMDMVGGGSGMGGQQQLMNAGPGPSSMGNLPQQSPASVMLMSPTNNLLNGSGGPMSVPPPTPGGEASGLGGGGQGAGGGVGALASGASQDPEKRKLIQQQLVLLLHAHKCQQRERTNDQQQCALPHCSTMKSVLTHMMTCSEGRSCTVPHCASSRQIINHWKSCTRTDCPVCLPLKQMTDNKNSRGAGGQVSTNGPLSQDSNSTNGPRFSARSAVMASNFDAFLGPNMSDNVPSVPGQIRGLPPTRPSLPPSLAAAAASLASGPDSVPGAGGGDGGGGFPPRWPPPEGASIQKEWHKQVTIDLRNHLVSKLVKAIFPSPDPAAMHDQRIKDLIQYARKVEKEMFELANDREEYYHLLAEKIYKIQKELQEKKQRRLEQQQNRQTPADPGGPPSGGGSGPSSSFDGALVAIRSSLSDSLVRAPATAAALSSTHLAANANGGKSSGINGGSAAPSGIKTEDQNLSVRAGSSSSTTTPAPKYESNVKMEVPDGDLDKPTTSTGGDAAATESKSLVKIAKKVFTVDELKNALLPIWDKLERMDDAIPFRVPVDTDLLGIPDYFDIIRNPMDLSTMKEKLLNGDYTDPWQFCDDMWLMFDNAWLYNRKNSKVYKYCTKLSETFMDDIDPVMRSLGYCCGRKLSFTPLALVCYGQPMCAIPRDAIYYCYEDNKSQFGVSSERYTYCKKCFDEIPGESINMSDDPSSENLIQKKNFKQLKNDQIEYEPFLDCVDCGRKWHQICALHMDQIYHGGFVCESCLRMRVKKRPENRFSAKRMAHCKLSLHLEKRVNDYLKNKLPPDQPAGDVIIRVLSSGDKEVEIKPHMKSKFCTTGQFPEKFPYRAKAIFAFEVIDGVEVCFFGLHVQEFGSSCPAPNNRRVYIAYLDSVHFFTPKLVRTQVYHEILLGYLDYVKKLGYTMAHIWACPPSEGDDYIFHCHPPEQKIPKPKRLQEWYKKLLDRGIVERVVTDYKDIYEFYQKEEPLGTIAELPFFEGDYWPNVVEECIREVDAEEAERRREAEAQAAAGTGMDEMEDETDEIFGQGKKRNAKGHKKSKSKSKSTNYKKSKKGGSGTGNDLTDKIVTALEKHKEVFFVVRLYSKQSASALPVIVDPDPNITCEFMDGRDSFLSTARERHWEFSSLRRAKFSTLALCYELHTQGSDKFVYTCNTCKNTNAKWHCGECEDFDLCQGCYEKSHHEHKMEPIKSIIGADDPTSNQEQGAQNPRDRNESIQRCIQSLVHACQCRDANCRRLSCHKMKRVVQHTKMCKKRQNGSCPVCKQLIALCLYHARHCQEGNCPVPFCQNIRQKLAEQQAQLKKKRDRDMMRRINFMSSSNQPPGAATTAVAIAGGAPPTVPYQQQNPQASPLPMGSMLSPGTSAGQPSINPTAIQVARDIEKIAAHQHQVGGGVGQYQQMIGRMPAPRGPAPPMAMGGMQAVGPRMPMSSMQAPPGQQLQQQQQQPMWDASGGNPRGYHPSMQMNQRLQQRMPPPMVGVGRPGMAPSMSEGMHPPPPGEPRLLTPHQNEKVQIQLTRLKAAKSPEERDMIMREMQQDPLVLQTILRAFQRSGQQPPAQLQQQAAWSDQMMNAAGQGPPTRPTMQPQQYYGGGQPRMMQQSQPPPGQGFQQQMQMPPDMNGPPPRHMGGYGNPYGGGQQGGGGGIYGNAAGLRQPISPQQQQATVGGGSSMMASSNILNQVRSPQTSSMASPSPANIHSPHIGASSMMHHQQQHQLPANIMADPSGNDMMGGGDQDKLF